MKPSTAEIQVKDLDHYGIIAGIIDEIGLVEKINELVGTHHRQKVTPGLAVKAMIINGLGMFSALSSRIPLRLTATRGRSFIFVREIL